MMRQLSPPLRRIAALALLVVAIAIAALVTVVPFRSRMASLQEEIEAERTLLGQFLAVGAQKEQADARARLGRTAAESPAYLKGDSEALKAAALQASLSALAGASGLRLLSTQALPVREREEVRLIGVRVQFTAAIEPLRSLLNRLETQRPFLFVEAMQVQPVSPFAHGDPEHAGQLTVRLDVFAATPPEKKG